MSEQPSIGGFFPLQLPLKVHKHNLLALWGIPKKPHAFFSNERSALAYVLKIRKPRTIWIPAYSCSSLAEAAQAMKIPVHFFPIDAALSPDIDFLAKKIQAGDVVLAIDYFGRAPSEEFRTFVRSRQDVIWVEDRAQSLSTGVPAWGEYELHSPRKLLGVADGGVLVSDAPFPTPDFTPDWRNHAEFIIPALLRFEDVREVHNTIWHSAHQRREQDEHTSLLPMSRISHAILAATDARPLMQKRRKNYATLQHALGEHRLLPVTTEDFVPFAFALRVNNQAEIHRHLHAHGVFTATYWPHLSAPRTLFPEAHLLAESIVALPVDARYGAPEMKRMIALVKQVLK